MDEYNALTTADQQIVYTALEMLGSDIDGAYSILQDEGIFLYYDDLEEISKHFSLI